MRTLLPLHQRLLISGHIEAPSSRLHPLSLTGKAQTLPAVRLSRRADRASRVLEAIPPHQESPRPPEKSLSPMSLQSLLYPSKSWLHRAPSTVHGRVQTDDKLCLASLVSKHVQCEKARQYRCQPRWVKRRLKSAVTRRRPIVNRLFGDFGHNCPRMPRDLS